MKAPTQPRIPALTVRRGLLPALALLVALGGAPDLFAQKIRLDERGAHGVTQAYHQGNYFIAWAGESNRLYVMRSEEGVDWRSKVALDERSSHAPDLASDGEYLYMTWVGERTNDLYVIRSRDGVDWSNKVRLNERSDARPAIAAAEGGPLLLAWKGETSDKIHVLRSRDGVDWRAKVALDEETLNGPTLAAFDGDFYLAWTGVSNNDLYVMRSEEGVEWRAKIRLDERGRKAPSLAGFDGRLYLAWQGDSRGDIYVMESDRGVDWRSKQRLDERTLKSLKLTGGHKLSLAFQGESSNNLYVLLIREAERVISAPANEPPLATDDVAVTERGREVIIDVLYNDADDDALVVIDVETPINGTARINDDGTISYLPNAQFIGNEVFAYLVEDSQGETAEARVRVTVEAGAIEQELEETGRATLRGLYFDFDSATIRPESYDVLATVLAILQNDPQAQFTIEGHTSAEGEDAYNMNLSRDRAQAVVSWLVGRGIGANRLDARGYGESRPVAANDTEEGRALNRRVEIVARQ